MQAYANGGRQADLGGVAKKLVAAGPQNPEALRMAILAFNTVNDLDGAEMAAGLMVPLAVDRPDLAQFLEQVRTHIAAQRAARETAGPFIPPPPPAPEKGGGGQ